MGRRPLPAAGLAPSPAEVAPGKVERDFVDLRFLRPYETDIANLEKSFSVALRPLGELPRWV